MKREETCECELKVHRKLKDWIRKLRRIKEVLDTITHPLSFSPSLPPSSSSSPPLTVYAQSLHFLFSSSSLSLLLQNIFIFSFSFLIYIPFDSLLIGTRKQNREVVVFCLIENKSRVERIETNRRFLKIITDRKSKEKKNITITELESGFTWGIMMRFLSSLPLLLKKLLLGVFCFVFIFALFFLPDTLTIRLI